jgi:hypothetical protein
VSYDLLIPLASSLEGKRRTIFIFAFLVPSSGIHLKEPQVFSPLSEGENEQFITCGSNFTDKNQKFVSNLIEQQRRRIPSFDRIVRRTIFGNQSPAKRLSQQVEKVNILGTEIGPSSSQGMHHKINIFFKQTLD